MNSILDNTSISHTEYMQDCASEVEIVRDITGFYSVNCYNHDGHYIGGVSRTIYDYARYAAETFAAFITSKKED